MELIGVAGLIALGAFLGGFWVYWWASAKLDAMHERYIELYHEHCDTRRREREANRMNHDLRKRNEALNKQLLDMG